MPKIHLKLLAKKSANFLNFILVEKLEISENTNEKIKRLISTVENSFRIALVKIKTAG